MADDLELSFVQIGVNEAMLRRIIDRHQPEFAVGVTAQNDAKSSPEGTGKYLSQISSPKFRTARHEIDCRRCVGRSQEARSDRGQVKPPHEGQDASQIKGEVRAAY
jgi:hypothetical protein